MKPLFLRSEGFRGPGEAGDSHGTEGPLTVSRRARSVSPITEAFIEAGIAAGHPAFVDFNGETPEGFGHYHFTIRGGRHETAAHAFLSSARDRTNSTVGTTAEVRRLVIRDDRATGVVLAANGREETIGTEGEVILSTGAIGSPTCCSDPALVLQTRLSGLGLRPSPTCRKWGTTCMTTFWFVFRTRSKKMPRFTD